MDVSITLGVEGDDVEVGVALVNERQNGADGCANSLHCVGR